MDGKSTKMPKWVDREKETNWMWHISGLCNDCISDAASIQRFFRIFRSFSFLISIAEHNTLELWPPLFRSLSPFLVLVLFSSSLFSLFFHSFCFVLCARFCFAFQIQRESMVAWIYWSETIFHVSKPNVPIPNERNNNLMPRTFQCSYNVHS